MDAWTVLGIFLLGAGIGALLTRIATIGQLRRVKEGIGHSVKSSYDPAA